MTKSYYIRTWQMNDETQTTLTTSLGSMPQLNPHFQYFIVKTKIIASESSLSVYFVKHDNKYIIIFKPSA